MVKTVNCFLNGRSSAVGHTVLLSSPLSKCTAAQIHPHPDDLEDTHPHPPGDLRDILHHQGWTKRSSLFSMSSPFWSPGKTTLGGEGGGGVSQIRDLVRPYMEPSMAHQGGCCNSCIPNYLQPHLLLYPLRLKICLLRPTAGKMEKQKYTSTNTKFFSKL